MLRNEKISISLIKRSSYSDFIGLINQWNTPPGSFSTLSKLAVFSGINVKSHLLDVACTTGFSSRELALRTGCSGTGFDISKKSISMANYNKRVYAPKIKISYKIADGYFFKPKDKFTHIVIGSGLAFFSDPKKMLNRCIDMLVDGGFILAAPYYQIRSMPNTLIRETSSKLGIPIISFNNFSYKAIMNLYNKLEIIYEDRNKFIVETDDELIYYCNSVISRACQIHKINDQNIYKAMFDKLYKFRKLINKGRQYQEYCVLVLRYRKSVYPNRWVALF